MIGKRGDDEGEKGICHLKYCNVNYNGTGSQINRVWVFFKKISSSCPLLIKKQPLMANQKEENKVH
jgi:hypothetical protein